MEKLTAEKARELVKKMRTTAEGSLKDYQTVIFGNIDDILKTRLYIDFGAEYITLLVIIYHYNIQQQEKKKIANNK